MKPTRSAWALRRSNPSTVIPAIWMRRARIRRTASGCSAVSPMRSPVLMRRNSGPARRLATACQASNARTGQVSACLPRQADLRPLPDLVRLGTSDAQAQPAGNGGYILDLQRHQFGAAQCPGEAAQQQGAVAPAARAGIAGGHQLAQHGQGQCRGLLWRAAMGAQQPLQRTLDVAMGRIPRQIIEAVHFSRCRRGRDGHKVPGGAPVGKMLPVGLVGAQRRRGRGIARQRLGRRKGGDSHVWKFRRGGNHVAVHNRLGIRCQLADHGGETLRARRGRQAE